MTKTLAELQALCDRYGIAVPPQRRPAKEPYLHALRDHFWTKENPGRPLPEQVEPMLLGDWSDLDGDEAVRPKDGDWFQKVRDAAEEAVTAGRGRDREADLRAELLVTLAEGRNARVAGWQLKCGGATTDAASGPAGPHTGGPSRSPLIPSPSWPRPGTVTFDGVPPPRRGRPLRRCRHGSARPVAVPVPGPRRRPADFSGDRSAPVSRRTRRR